MPALGGGWNGMSAGERSSILSNGVGKSSPCDDHCSGSDGGRVKGLDAHTVLARTRYVSAGINACSNKSMWYRRADVRGHDFKNRTGLNSPSDPEDHTSCV